MPYIADLNKRINDAFEAGNPDRADYLSGMITEVITTGGPFSFRDTPATPQEKQLYNQSAGLLARNSTMYSQLNNGIADLTTPHF
jgi:hypothetical protein